MLRRFIYLIIISLLASSCQDDIKNRKLEFEIQNELKSNTSINELRLDSISQFEWDTLVILKPYVSIEKLEDSLNLDFSNVNGKFQHYDEYLAIAFFNNGKCVSLIELLRNFELLDQEKIVYKKEDSNILFVEGF